MAASLVRRLLDKKIAYFVVNSGNPTGAFVCKQGTVYNVLAADGLGALTFKDVPSDVAHDLVSLKDALKLINRNAFHSSIKTQREMFYHGIDGVRSLRNTLESNYKDIFTQAAGNKEYQERLTRVMADNREVLKHLEEDLLTISKDIFSLAGNYDSVALALGKEIPKAPAIEPVAPLFVARIVPPVVAPILQASAKKIPALRPETRNLLLDILAQVTPEEKPAHESVVNALQPWIGTRDKPAAGFADVAVASQTTCELLGALAAFALTRKDATGKYSNKYPEIKGDINTIIKLGIRRLDPEKKKGAKPSWLPHPQKEKIINAIQDFEQQCSLLNVPLATLGQTMDKAR